jgi:signal peptidase
MREDPLGPIYAPTYVTEKPERKALGKSAASSLVTLVLILLVAFTVFSVLAPFIGWEVSTVVSGSMEPRLHTGSIIITRPIDPEDIKVGNIILFEKSDVNTIHRIVSVETTPKLRFYAKGDANKDRDPSPIYPDEVKGILFGQIPYLGFLFSIVKTPLGLVLTIGIPSLLLLAVEINRKFIRNDGMDKVDKFFWPEGEY